MENSRRGQFIYITLHGAGRQLTWKDAGYTIHMRPWDQAPSPHEHNMAVGKTPWMVDWFCGVSPC